MSEETAYYEALPEELKPFAKVGDTDEIKPVGVFADEINNQRQWMGNSVRLCGPDAPDEERAAFRNDMLEKFDGLMITPDMDDPDSRAAAFKSLGQPETADAYKLPEGVQLEGEQLGQLKAAAFRASATQHQFNEYAAAAAEASEAAMNGHSAQHEEGIATLKGEWGAAYDERIGQVTAFLKSNPLTPAYVIEQLQQGNLPADQVKWMHSYSETISAEGGEFHGQDNDPNPVILDRMEASARAEEATKKLYDPSISNDQRALLQKRAEAYEYMALGKRPPEELLRFVQ